MVTGSAKRKFWVKTIRKRELKLKMKREEEIDAKIDNESMVKKEGAFELQPSTEEGISRCSIDIISTFHFFMDPECNFRVSVHHFFTKNR